jgi:allantoin racemase
MTKPIRYWHQSMTELEGLENYRAFLARHASKVLDSSVSVDLHGLKPGSYHGRAVTPALRNAFVYHRILDQILDYAIEAERSGFDAFVIGSFSEPFLREIRSVVRIPVVSILESTLLVSCSLGKSVAPIANGPEIAAVVDSAVESHGMGKRVLPAVSLYPAWHEPELAQAFGDPGRVIEAFTASARACIAAGAEVIVPAEGVLATVLSDNGVTAIDGAPVMDVFATTWHYGRMLIDLQRTFGLQVSDVGTYARGDLGLIEALTNRVPGHAT